MTQDFEAKWGWGFGIESMDNMWDVANTNCRDYLELSKTLGQDNRMKDP